MFLSEPMDWSKQCQKCADSKVSDNPKAHLRDEQDCNWDSRLNQQQEPIARKSKVDCVLGVPPRKEIKEGHEMKWPQAQEKCSADPSD